MPQWYIDTSVLAAYYCPENLSAAAERRLMTLATPFISLLTEVELASAVSRKYRMGELADSAAQRILQLFRRQQSEGYFRIAPLSLSEYRQAFVWISGLSTSLRALDALHFASAAAVHATVLTADAAMHGAAVALGVDATLLKASEP